MKPGNPLQEGSPAGRCYDLQRKLRDKMTTAAIQSFFLIEEAFLVESMCRSVGFPMCKRSNNNEICILAASF